MTVLGYFLVCVTVVFATACVLFRRKNRAFEGMMCKFMASFGFISVAVVGYTLNPVDTRYFCLVCFALMFGFFGDVLLGIKEIAPTFKPKLIPLGTLYFLVGHLLYLTAFISRSGFSLFSLVFCAIGIVAAALVIKFFKMKISSKLKPILCVYFGVLFFKAANAGVLAFETKEASFILAFIGALIFIMSDTCLGMVYFTPIKRKNVWVTFELVTYYAAQLLLSSSVALLK